MVGFAASLYKRGVRFVYVPTTLLAQVDAGIGGKTGVNFDNYKNMLGVIRQPEFVYVCPQVLSSLPHRDFCSGAAEMLKTFIIEDDGNYAAAVKTLTSMQKEYAMVSDDESAEYWSDCINAYSEELTSLITAAVRVKAGVVSRDQYEGGERRKLNLGHTFAHAVETLARRGATSMDSDNEIVAITHGEAVAMGLVLAARLSDRVFHGDMQTPTQQECRMRSDLLGCGINPDCPFVVGEMSEIMKKDKKGEGGKVHFVLIRETGDVVVKNLSVDEVIRLMA
jgi:3-dehydroquinate synthetase